MSGSDLWLSKQHGLALLKSPAKFLCCCSHCCHYSWQLLRCIGKSLLSLAPQEVCSESFELQNYYLFVSVEGKAHLNQQKHSPQSQSIFNDLSGEMCISRFFCVNPSCGAHSVSSNSGIFCHPPPAQIRPCIFAVYYAEDTD